MSTTAANYYYKLIANTLQVDCDFTDVSNLHKLCYINRLIMLLFRLRLDIWTI